MKAVAPWLFGLCLASGGGVAVATLDERRDLAFRVLLDGEPIGSHSFRIRNAAGGERQVLIRADFDVRVLFVPVYRYRHRNFETWRDGCLVGIDSRTDSNGTTYRVAGRADGDTFRLTTQETSRQLADPCLMSFAYWDRRMLDQKRLLNAQTGEVVEVEVLPLGVESLVLGSETVAADAYRIVSQADDVDIRVFYDRRNGAWLALESSLENGRLMRYEPQRDARSGTDDDATPSLSAEE